LRDDPIFYVVGERVGSRLLLYPDDGDTSGWVQSDSVIPVDTAIEFSTKQIRANPKDAFSFAMRGMLHRDKGELDAALVEYDQAVKLDTKSVFAFVGRARVWRDKNDYAKGVADYSEAIKLDSRRAGHLKERAQFHSEHSEYDKAIRDQGDWRL
jgi:tetratricopeptide (TPR) repeat protein